MQTTFNTALPIAIGSDHAGFEYKKQIIDWFQHSNLFVKDFGTTSIASVDIRAGLCWNNEVAKLVRQHNNANIICIPARFVAKELACEMIDTFLSTTFEGGRHEKRVGKIDC